MVNNFFQPMTTLQPIVERSASMLPIDPEMGGTESDGIPLAQYFASLRRHWLKILGICAGCVLATFIISKRIPSVYESTASLEIQRQNPGGLIGHDAAPSLINDSDQYLDTQIKIIQQDSVLRPVAERFGLTAQAQNSATAPVHLKHLRVVRPPNTYLLQISYRSGDPVLAAQVANAIAQSYLQYTFRSRLADSRRHTEFMEHQLDELRATMEQSNAAVTAFERELGVVDADEKTNILSARLMQLNTEYTNAQADRIRKEAEYTGLKQGTASAAEASDQGEGLKRLNEQLHEAEQKFSDVRQHFGPRHPEYLRQAALIAELKAQIQGTVESVTARTKVSYEDATQRERILHQELTQAKSDYDKLNARSFQYQTLKMEAQDNRKLYDDLEQRIKEADINANFENSATHISDEARPGEKPLYPNIPLNLGLAFAFSLMFSVAGAIVYDVVNDKIKEVAEIPSNFGVEVLGLIPATRDVSKLFLKRTAAPLSILSGNLFGEELGEDRSSLGLESELPAIASGTDASLYEESIRRLWSSFKLSNTSKNLHSLMVTSAMPGEGKTTVSIQMALANARHDLRTLLIDADLRRPSTHRTLGVSLAPGLADAMDRPADWKSFVRQSALNPNLHVLTAGAARDKSLDRLGRAIPELLSLAEREFDLIIIDSPPLLAFAEPLHMATAVDGVMVIACADKTSRTALYTVLRTLQRLRANVVGITMNRVENVQNAGYYAYRQYSNRPSQSLSV
jgi:polysaccharide biosynthesis transport protein